MTTKIIPTFLNEDFILEALNSKYKKIRKIKSLNIERNTLGGNYCSNIYRAKVEFFTENKNDEKNEEIQKANLLIKELFTNVANSSQEYFTYTNLLPLMEDILREADIKMPLLSPNLFLARKDESELHVFQDMNALGYKICDRYVGFNLDESKIVVDKLAYFHAASMLALKKHPELEFEIGKYFWLDNPVFSDFIKFVIDENIKHIAKIIVQWPGYEIIADKLLKNTGKEFERRFFEMFQKPLAKIKVIAHGDLWIKNILIKYDKYNEAEDAILIDFQNCFVGSPAFDLQNLFMTSLNSDVNWSYLICRYHNTLNRTLSKFQVLYDIHFKIPRFREIQYEMARTEYFTFYALMFAFPQTNLSEELTQDMDFEHFFEPKRLAHNREDMFNNPRVLETLKSTLKRLDALGVLN